MADLPIVITSAGRQPQPPQTLLAQLIAAVAATNPGYTATLPGSLIEDISSTDVGALVICDSAVTELINSLTPVGANQFLLLQLGQMYLGTGTAPAPPTNTGVSVIFSGPPGFVIGVGFLVSDGTYQYAVQDGGVIGAGGTTSPLAALATVPGSWAVPVASVSQLVTSVPSTVSPPVTVTNPLAGTPGGTAETEEAFRARVLQAGLATAVGMPTFLKTTLEQVTGVQPRLVSVLQQTGGGWEVIAGGSGDPYEIAYAIFTSIFDVSTLVGSTLRVLGITNANPGVVTTDKDHNYANGQVAQINGIVGMVNLNGVNFTVTVVDHRRFSIGINTTGYPAWVSGGVVTPNLRDVTVNINDYPNLYSVPFVNPPNQTVTVAVTYSTSQPNFVSQAAVAQLAAPALADYVNSVAVGQPMSLYEMQSTFLDSIATVLSAAVVTFIGFSVSINGVGTAPVAGTISGDPESYFSAVSTGVTVTQV